MSKRAAQTLEDIARLANVSKSTVSRALNDSALVKPETKARIQAIARALDFRINASARNLRLRQSHTVAFVAPAYYPEFLSGEDFFGLEMLGGIGRGLHGLGYDLLIIHVDPGETAWARAYLDSGRVDGFVLMTANHRPAQIEELIAMGAPFVGWEDPVPGLDYCSVSGDNLAGGTLATEHLLRTGRRRIAFLGGPNASLTVRQRFQGYEDALRAAGRRVDPRMVAYGDYTHASGGAAMECLLERSPDLDAVFVNSDLMAIAAIGAAQNRGRRVPEDIAVVGYDDLSIASYSNPPLTTIRQNLPLVGRLLAQDLVQYIQSGTVTHVTTPVELVIRRSA